MISFLKTVAKILLVTKNFAAVLWNIFVSRRPTVTVFRNGYTLPVDPSTWGRFISYAGFFRHFPGGSVAGSIATIPYRSGAVQFDFSGAMAPGMLSEFFGKSLPYRIVPADVAKIRGAVVVDVGASLGDSSVWFALHGARKVYAFEPIRDSYLLCKRNVALNGLEDVCEVSNVAVGGREKKSFFLDEDSRKFMGSAVGSDSSSRGADVPILTLSDVVKRYGIPDGSFLKMDCEGYEYGIILDSPKETLRVFAHIMLEYHFGYERLREQLAVAGFSVRCSSPERVHQPNAEGPYKNLRVGYVFAERIPTNLS